jgi:hypothetical protein
MAGQIETRPNKAMVRSRWSPDSQSAMHFVDYVNGEEPTLVAESVEEFFETLNSSAAKLGVFE